MRRWMGTALRAFWSLIMTTAATRFSLAQSRAIVRDLFAPKEWIYWCDFLTTIVVGYFCFGLTRHLFETSWEPRALRFALVLVAFAVQCACFYRAVMFVHEIVHLPSNRFGLPRRLELALRNSISGSVVHLLLTSRPSSAGHLWHPGGRRISAAGQYVAVVDSWCICRSVCGCPCLAVFRFGIMTPLTWVCPPLRRFIYQHASSLVANPAYIRPLPTAIELRYMRLQEAGCFLFLVGGVVVARVVLSSLALSGVGPRLRHRRGARFDELPAHLGQPPVDQRRQAEHLHPADDRLRNFGQRLVGRGADQSCGPALSRDASPLPIDAVSQHAGRSPAANATSCRPIRFIGKRSRIRCGT